MNKQLKMMLVVWCLQGVITLQATSEFRSPLPFDRLYLHYPFESDVENCWALETITAMYGRTADETFRTKCPKVCAPGTVGQATSLPSFNKTTTNKEPLSALFFGKADFRGEEAFPGGSLSAPCTQGLLALLSPRFEYIEYGFYLGLHGYSEVGECGCWRVGGRVQIPVMAIEVNQRGGCCPATPDGPVAGNTIVRSFTDTEPQSSHATLPTNAYRWDMLNTLQYAGQPLVQYPGGTAVTIAGELISIDPNSVDPDLYYPTMQILKRQSGEIVKADLQPFDGAGFDSFPAIYQPDPRTNGDLPANGSGADDVYYFLDGVNYSSIDPATQAQMFLVLSGGGDEALNPYSLFTQNLIEQALSQASSSGSSSSAEQFFGNNCCINFFQSERTVAVGDLDLLVYAGRHTECGFVDFVLGGRAPTGKQNKNPGNVLFQATGHNGHGELRGEIIFGWHPTHWFALDVDTWYSHVFKHTERKAAAFVGAGVINIGPTVNADVSWDYGVVNIDATFFHPNCCDLGGLIGYEFFGKRSDKITFCSKTAVDCCGNEGTLSNCLLERNTNAQTHKLRGEVFNRFHCWEMFGGGSIIVAGKNAMQEFEGHFGVKIEF